MKPAVRTLMLLSLLTGTACSHLGTVDHAAATRTRPQAAATSSSASSLDNDTAPLHYTQQWKGRTAAELATELDRLNRNYANSKTEDNRLRLALFHVMAPKGDRNRALQLLDVAPGDGHGAGRNHPVAALLIPLLQELAREEDSTQQTQQKLRDEQKRSEVLQQKADALQQKLDAIREIEKKMLERPGR